MFYVTMYKIIKNKSIFVVLEEFYDIMDVHEKKHIFYDVISKNESYDYLEIGIIEYDYEDEENFSTNHKNYECLVC